MVLMSNTRNWISLALSAAALLSFITSTPCLAAHTKLYGEKEGFKKQPKDIITTLKQNEVTQFQSFLDGLQQAYGMDAILRGKGPFTVFAASDNAFKHLQSDDFQALFANK